MSRLIIGAILGALGAYVFTTSPSFQKKLRQKAQKALPPGIRLPKPTTTVALPTTLEDFQNIDDVICGCTAGLADAAAMTPDESISELQLCAASQLYAPEEIPWPPVAGDHPTIHQLWGFLGSRIRRLIVRGELEQACGPAIVPGEVKVPGAAKVDPTLDEWGEPNINTMIEEGQFGDFRWRVYLDNFWKPGTYYWTTWRAGTYDRNGPFNSAAEAKNSVIAWMQAQPVPGAGISPKPNPFHRPR